MPVYTRYTIEPQVYFPNRGAFYSIDSFEVTVV